MSWADDDADVGIDGAVLLGDDVAGLGLIERHGCGPAWDGDARVCPFMCAGVTGDESEMTGNMGAWATGVLDPVRDGLVALVAAGTVPAIPAGGEVGGVSALAEGDLGDGLEWVVGAVSKRPEGKEKGEEGESE